MGHHDRRELTKKAPKDGEVGLKSAGVFALKILKHKALDLTQILEGSAKKISKILIKKETLIMQLDFLKGKNKVLQA